MAIKSQFVLFALLVNFLAVYSAQLNDPREEAAANNAIEAAIKHTFNMEQLRDQLLFAASNGKADMVEDLLKQKADIDARDNSDGTALYRACQGGHQDVVKVLLSHKPELEIRYRWSGDTPLLLAVSQDDFEIVKMLVDAGANFHAKSAVNDSNVLAYGCRAQPKMLKLFLDLGVQINETNRFGEKNSALIDTLMYSNGEGSILLISYGADLKFKDWMGRIPINLIMKNKFALGDLRPNKKIIEQIDNAKAQFGEALVMLAPPLRRIIIGYFGTNSYLDESIDFEKYYSVGTDT